LIFGLTAAALAACQGTAPEAGQGLDEDRGVFTLRHGALGCMVEIVVEDMDPDAARAAVLEGLPILATVEKTLSVWDPQSEVSRVNRLAGDREVPVGELLWETLLRCQVWNAESRGAHDVTVGALVEYARKAAASNGGEPGVDASGVDNRGLDAALARVGFEKLVLDPEKRTVRFSVQGMSLDFDSVSKGIAVEMLGDHLRRAGVRSASISAGGSTILSIGPVLPSPPRLVDLADDTGREGTSVALRDEAVSTSGNWRRRAREGSAFAGHHFDPRTGKAPDARLVSASVVCASAADSDAWSTAAAVLGASIGAGALPARVPMRVVYLTRTDGGGVAVREIRN
jgi:thiamine biosynthesis lipoprotein